MSNSKNSHSSTPNSTHGPKTQAAIAKQAHSHTKEEHDAAGPREVPDGEVKDIHDKELEGELHTGKHRLVENRVQHDDADKASDKNRLADDAKKHKHGNPGGKLNGGPSHQ
ncbi:MAG: hypothetical protein H0U66_17745 [Gemmatimonadaceae bacterium]|nr:hypothetical protein [Gemmatimonadaceae bacterium]